MPSSHSLLPPPVLAEGENAVVDGPEGGAEVGFGEAEAEEVREPGGGGEEGGEEAGGMVWPEEEQDPFAAPVEGNSTKVQMEDEAEGREWIG